MTEKTAANRALGLWGRLGLAVLLAMCTLLSLQPVQATNAASVDAAAVDTEEPLLAATGSVSNVTAGGSGPAHAGDLLRLSVAMTNVGSIDVTAIGSSLLSLPAGFTLVVGSGAISGDGVGFSAGDGGFQAGTLTAGKSAIYHVDVITPPIQRAGSALFSLYVAADGVISIPVVGRVQTAPEAMASVWLPLVMHNGGVP